jgi:hypothetical protein
MRKLLKIADILALILFLSLCVLAIATPFIHP